MEVINKEIDINLSHEEQDVLAFIDDFIITKRVMEDYGIYSATLYKMVKQSILLDYSLAQLKNVDHFIRVAQRLINIEGDFTLMVNGVHPITKSSINDLKYWTSHFYNSQKNRPIN